MRSNSERCKHKDANKCEQLASVAIKNYATDVKISYTKNAYLHLIIEFD